MARRSLGARLVRGAALLLGAFVAITALQVLLLRWIDPWTSAFMLSARLEAAREGDEKYRTRYEWVDFEQISRYPPIAVVVAEDQNFAAHRGFDVEAIRKAAEHNAKSRRVRGASTITQQVAKNLFLWKSRSYLRKGLEAWYTVLIELTLPKRRTLEIYLNIAEFGRGVYGVEAAAQKFWRKEAKRLTRVESATLAAVLPNPRRLRADRPGPYVQRRRDSILGQMGAFEMNAASGGVPRVRAMN
jgi:monofunctional biosynthetic peptidoglycan transglycosylase